MLSSGAMTQESLPQHVQQLNDLTCTQIWLLLLLVHQQQGQPLLDLLVTENLNYPFTLCTLDTHVPCVMFAGCKHVHAPSLYASLLRTFCHFGCKQLVHFSVQRDSTLQFSNHKLDIQCLQQSRAVPLVWLSFMLHCGHGTYSIQCLQTLKRESLVSQCWWC